MKVGAIILAAGSSSRLGQPKQLIQLNNEFILEKLHDNLKSLTDSAYVITGCYHSEIEQQFPKMNLIYNESWEKGMGSSISTAVDNLKSNYSHLLICVCDQALIEKSHYQILLKTSYENPSKIIASIYDSIIGVPVLFPKAYFNDLAQLDNSFKGAKHVIGKYNKEVMNIKCPNASFDLDTKENLEYLMKKPS
jgi:molybdenum cofactor cytidylyltransferase